MKPHGVPSGLFVVKADGHPRVTLDLSDGSGARAGANFTNIVRGLVDGTACPVPDTNFTATDYCIECSKESILALIRPQQCAFAIMMLTEDLLHPFQPLATLAT